MGIIAKRQLHPRGLAEFSFLYLKAGLHQEAPFANNPIRIITTISLFCGSFPHRDQSTLETFYQIHCCNTQCFI